MHDKAMQGHYLLHVSKVCAGGWPLPLCHYSPSE